jgi:hypothetical protein
MTLGLPHLGCALCAAAPHAAGGLEVASPSPARWTPHHALTTPHVHGRALACGRACPCYVRPGAPWIPRAPFPTGSFFSAGARPAPTFSPTPFLAR